MKTDRFDEEFRRKLLGLPADPDPGEVERIHGFVRANKPALPSPGWGKLLLYGGSSLLLIGSLSYNFVQNYRNTRLQSSIDSLAHRSDSRATSASEVIRHDTVYITRYGKSNAAESYPSAQTDGKETQQLAQSNPLDESKRREAIGIRDKEAPLLPNEIKANLPRFKSPHVTIKTGKPTTDTVAVVTNQRTEQPDQLRNGRDESIAILPKTSSERSVAKNRPFINGKKTGNSPTLSEIETIGNYPNNRGLATRRLDARHHKLARQSVSIEERTGLSETTYSGKARQHTDEISMSSGGLATARTKDIASGEAISERTRQPIIVHPLTQRITISTSNQLALIVPGRPLVVSRNVSPAKSTRKSWHLTLPTLSVPNAQYRIGGELLGGIDDQLGGSVLGEVQLNRHWSLQAGLRMRYSDVFHYHDEQDFEEHQDKNFRQTYASQVPSSSDIEDIGQHSLLVQLPLQVAYHYPLGRQWGLRLGVGTDLDLWVRSVVSYNYRENSRSSQKGSSLIEEPVHLFNNLTVSTMLERSWKKWQFRAGPFISPQLRSVSYKPEDLSWGANLQVLYRLGK